jgi:hypothetical protein
MTEMKQGSTPEGVKVNESAERIGFVECRTMAQEGEFVMQLPYPQCFFQVHRFLDTDHYLATLGKSDKWVHTQVGSRPIALTFNGCMMHYSFDGSNATERARYLIDTLKEAAKWYDSFLELKIEN